MKGILRSLLLLAVVLLASQSSKAQLIVNELSQGPSGVQEYVELVVTGNPTCDSQYVDIRGWILDDNNGWHKPGSGSGIAPGCMRLSMDAQWANVKMGAIILIYNAGDKNGAITIPDDPSDANSDCVYVLPHTSTLIQNNTSIPNSGGVTSYAGITWSSGGNWNTVGMRNGGDSFHTVDPNNIGSAHHAVSWGDNTSSTIIFFSGAASGDVFFMDNSVSDDPFNQNNWTNGSAGTADETPGAPNNPANAAWLDMMSNSCMPIVGAITTAPPLSLCPGDSVFVGGAWQTTAGTYYDTIPTTGCDSIVETTVSIGGATTITTNQNICPGDSAFLGGAWQTMPGTYNDTIISAGGCDSIIQTTLAFYVVPGSANATAICIGDSIFLGGAWQTTTGTYNDTLVSFYGCDSIHTTNLTVNPSYNDTVYASICNGDTYFAGGAAQTTSGTYVDVYPVTGGCDSTVNTILTVNPTYSMLDAAFICSGDSVFLGGAWQTTSGIYYDTLMTVSGCDSIIETDLTVGASTLIVIDTTVCEGTSVFAGGMLQTTAGTYYDTLSSVGCDTLIQTNLTVNPTYNDTLYYTACFGEFVTVGGVNYSTTGVYTDFNTTTLGCDSLYTIDLTALPLISTTRDTTVCNGDAVFAGGMLQTTTGTYYDTLFAPSVECDSIFITNLTVIPVYNSTVDTIVCFGEGVMTASGLQTTSGVYVDNLTSVDGCDSTITTNLTVLPAKSGTLNIDLCDGETYTSPLGNSYNTTGAYLETYPTMPFNCDSAVTINITVFPNPVADAGADTVVCEGASVQLTATGGGTYAWSNSSGSASTNVSPSVPTTYSVTVTDANGCTATDDVFVDVVTFNINIEVDPDSVLVIGESVQLDVSGDVADTYNWTPSAGLNSPLIANPIATPDNSTTYTVYATSDDGCTDTDDITLLVIESENLYAIPSAFSPNGSGPAENEVFRIITTGNAEVEEFKIFNRWGELIYEESIANPGGWDGTYQGIDQPIGTYVYYAQIRSLLTGELYTVAGNITLIR